MNRHILPVLIASMAVAQGASAAEDLRKVPAALDPAKAYLLVDTVNDPPGAGGPVIAFARYEPELEDIAGFGRAAKSRVPAGEDRRISTRSGRLLRFKGNRELHLIELTPGSWTIEGIDGTAASLGSYSFDLPAGRITDLGVFVISDTDDEGMPVEHVAADRASREC